LKDIHSGSSPQTFCNRRPAMLDNLTAAREYSRNSVSIGGIDQSHAQKASGVTTSIHFIISLPGRWGPLPSGMLRTSVWRCFGYPHIEKKQCLKRIPNCLDVKWFFY